MSSSLTSPPEYEFVHESKESNGEEIRPLSRPSIKSSIVITSNKFETLLISSAGDVLSSRCRNTPYPPLALNAAEGGKQRPYRWTDDIAAICCDSDSTAETMPACIPPWNRGIEVASEVESRPGLKGGAPLPAEVAPLPLQALHDKSFSFPDNTSVIDATPSNGFPSQEQVIQSAQAFRSLPIQSNHVDDEYSIVPIKSFDYSQFNEVGNDMLPESRHEDALGATLLKPVQQQSFHGIPNFLPYFSNIKVQQVSAHPLGAHVLLISQPGILYSYGLNIHGQLGIGILSNPRDVNQGYVMKPTMVTPLLENGGKAVGCAAGVTHSLVVVEMEERRIKTLATAAEVSESPEQRPEVLRLRNQASGSCNSELNRAKTAFVKHHQLYGFGRNDHMKIGLISPRPLTPLPPATAPYVLDEMECVPLPRRVALRSCVIQKSHDPIVDASRNGGNDLPPFGIFAVVASVEHSAALVHRTSGDIELYTWGNATFGALGVPDPENLDGTVVPSDTAFCIVPVPTFVAGLSKSSNPEVQAQSLLRNNEFPVKLSLSRCCSFVVTNIGRCFSFGTSEDGMLGLGRDVTETHTPMEIALPEPSIGESIVAVSAGAMHVSICTDVGSVYSWGARSHCGFPIQRPTPSVPVQRKPPTMKGPTPIEELIQFEWSPRRVLFSSSMDRSRNSLDRSRNESDQSCDAVKILLVHAGNDCSFFVTERGVVLSSGKNSGRLGQGEADNDVITPKPLFGGLHLFQQENHPLLVHHSDAVCRDGGRSKFVRSRRVASA